MLNDYYKTTIIWWKLKDGLNNILWANFSMLFTQH